MALRSRLLANYKHYIRRHTLHEPKSVTAAAYKLQNLGLRSAAEAELNHLAARGRSALVRSHANWRLAIWTYRNSQGPAGWQQVRRLIAEAEQGPLPREGRNQLAFLRVLCLSLEGNVTAAKRARQWHRLSDGRERSDVLLALSHGAVNPHARLQWIAKVFRNHGLSPPSLCQEPEVNVKSSLFDRLEVNDEHGIMATQNGPLVSVIMAAFNAEATIATALRSLSAQTWRNIEVLVVDDCSTDNTRGVIANHSHHDPRIRLLQMERNQGAYVARNHALSQCRGQYVTLHDSDDWSHPRKIEIQALHLEKEARSIACTSQRARADEALRFTRLNTKGWLIGMNTSSLMFRRQEIVTLLGGWDTVRIGADTELIRRIHAVVGKAAIAHLHTGPVCLQRLSEDSAVGNVATGFDGFEYGVRHLYAMAYQNAHKRGISLVRGEQADDRVGELRSPAIMEAERNMNQHYDVIVATDFRVKSPGFDTLVTEIRTQIEAGMQTGLICLYNYTANPSQSEVDLLAKALPLEQLRFICYGESASCNLLLIRDPRVLQTKHDLLPDIDAKRVIVVVDTMPDSGAHANSRKSYNITTCQESLKGWLGQPGSWYAEGPWIQQRLSSASDSCSHQLQLATKSWLPIQAERSRREREPEIWIKNREAPWRVGVFWDAARGGDYIRVESSDLVLHIVGLDRLELPSGIDIDPRWVLIPDRGANGPTGQKQFDVVWEPCRLQEQERGCHEILTSMAEGIPVILDPSYKSLFGDAASYCTSESLEEIVHQLCSHKDFYIDQANRAFQSLRQDWGAAMHLDRVCRVVGES